MGRRRLVLASLASVMVLAPLAWLWQDSLVPGTYSVMDMGYLEPGTGAAPANGHAGMHVTSVADLVETSDRPADVVVDLTAQRDEIELAPGRSVDGYSINGQSPGPAITATVGQLVEVRLTNKDVADGVALHWHGVDVPNAEDGVAGVTQDAVAPGGHQTYRFVVDHVGTYWYHSHQVSHEQVARGLFGALVVLPADGVPQDRELTALAHTFRGTRTINGKANNLDARAEPGETVRVRVVNTDNGPMQVWSDEAFRVTAIDGWDVNAPTPVSDKAMLVTAGGRADLVVTSPARVQLSGATALVIGPEGSAPPPKPVQPTNEVDLLTYGSPTDTGIDATKPDREFDYSIGRKPGFVDGRPGLQWSLNGHLYPDVPMFVVREDEVVVMHIENHTGTVHPMHLHGHHVLVLSRDGKASRGSPWWTDSLNVDGNESYDVAFVADNPGIWMDHCHNLNHAADGMVAHLMYEGVSTPYVVGGRADNAPE